MGAVMLTNTASYLIDGQILATLLCFGNLTEVTLAPPVEFDIDDGTVADMARAWPKLKTLRLTASSDLHHPSSISLLGLRVLAKHCPELTSLILTFDASIVPLISDSPETISQSSLADLDVGPSAITDPFLVTQLLSRLFPNLAEIYTLDEWRWNLHNSHEEDIAGNAEFAHYT